MHEKLDAVRATGVPVAVFYESPHRVVALVEAIAARWPECLLAVFADLSKKFEWLLRGAPEEVLAQLRANPNVEKGEYCLAVDLSPLPAPQAPEPVSGSAVAAMAERLYAGDTLKEAAAAAKAAGLLPQRGLPRHAVSAPFGGANDAASPPRRIDGAVFIFLSARE